MGRKLTEIEEYFLMDAENAVTVLSGFNLNPNFITEEEFDTYETTVHGMKSALANIGEPDLSAKALKLERASKEKNLALMAEETAAFIEALKAVIQKLEMKSKLFTDELADEDKAYLLEKLKEVKTACDGLQQDTAIAILENLSQKTWPESIIDFIDEVNVQLLHTAFKKAASAVNDVIEKL